VQITIIIPWVRKLGGVFDVSSTQVDAGPGFKAASIKGGDKLRFSIGAESWNGYIAVNGQMFVQVGSGGSGSGGVWQDEFRLCVMAVMEMAELLECESMVMCVDKGDKDLVRSFMYAGFELVHPDVYGHKEGYVLLGCEV